MVKKNKHGKQIPKNINKNITIKVDKYTASSGEYLPMIIKSFNKKCIIKGSHTARYLNITNTITFKFHEKQYSLGIPIAPYVFDKNGEKYYGQLK